MPAPSLPHRRARRGFTLIELTVALAIVALLFTAVVMSVGALTGTKAKSAAGELGGVIRSLYDTAALGGKTCRLVFLIPPEKDEENATQYWAECAAGNVTTSRDRDEFLKQETQQRIEQTKDARQKRERGQSTAPSSSSNRLDEQPSLQDLMAREKERVDSASKFQGYTAEEIKPRTLPKSVRLSLWTKHQRESVKSGLAFLYFFPQGFTEKAMVFVRQGNNVWTLSVSPLTGKTTVVGEELEIPRS